MAKWFGRWRKQRKEASEAAKEEKERQKGTVESPVDGEDVPPEPVSTAEDQTAPEADVTKGTTAPPAEDGGAAAESEVPSPRDDVPPARDVEHEVPEESVESGTTARPAAERDAGEPAAVQAEEAPAEPKGMFARLRAGLSRTRAGMTERIAALVKGRTAISEELFEELEEVLIQADVGVPTTLQIVEGVRERFKAEKSKNAEDLTRFVAEEMREILSVGDSTLTRPDDGPKVYMVVGVNGAGKTTTIGKLAARFTREGKRVLLGAGDTFRAAAIDQLAVWAERAGAELIRHQEGSDPGAVAYDAVHAARSRNADVLILDTAGRLQNKVNLMRELSKVYRVVEREWGAPPDETLLVVDANTGQNGLSQAKLFMEATPLTGVVLTKLDSSSKGGIVLAIAAETGIPVKLIGVGEAVDDLRDFDADDFIKALFPGLPEATP